MTGRDPYTSLTVDTVPVREKDTLPRLFVLLVLCVLSLLTLSSTGWAHTALVPTHTSLGPAHTAPFSIDEAHGEDSVETCEGDQPRERLRGKRAHAPQSSAETGASRYGGILRIGAVIIDRDPLVSAVTSSLTQQFRVSVRAQVEEVSSAFAATTQSYAQELYQDFLYWLNEKVHVESGSMCSVDSQAFEEEFLAWLHSSPEQLRDYSEAYLRERNAAISGLLVAYQEHAYREMVGVLQDIWQDAKDKYDRFARAAIEVKTAPGASHTDTLMKYGVSERWLGRFQSYRGRFDVFNHNDRFVEALHLITTAFQSDVTPGKIDSLFHLLTLIGAVAEEPDIPIMSVFGQIAQAYGDMANSLLVQIDTLAEHLRAHRGYCIGTGDAVDLRHHNYRKTFTKGTLVCPTFLSKDIYERFEPRDRRLYFWVNNTFIEGQEYGGGLATVRQAMELIKRAGEHGFTVYRDKEEDLAIIAKFYNTPYHHHTYGDGLSGLLKEADVTIDGIAMRIAALEKGVATVGLGACELKNLHGYLDRSIGLKQMSFAPRADPGSSQALRDASAGLKVQFAVSHIERRSGAYQTYSAMWAKLQSLSLLRLRGSVRKLVSPDSGCPECSNAAIEFVWHHAQELPGCEVRATDAQGDFVAHILASSDEFSVHASATVKELHSETLHINKHTIRVPSLPFTKVWSATLLVSLADEPETAATSTTEGSAEPAEEASHALGVPMPDDILYHQAKAAVESCKLATARQLLTQLASDSQSADIEAEIRAEDGARALYHHGEQLADDGQHEQALVILEQSKSASQILACQTMIEQRIAHVRSEVGARPVQQQKQNGLMYQQAKAAVRDCKLDAARRLLSHISSPTHKTEIDRAIHGEDTARSLYKRGRQLAHQGNFEDALAVLDEAHAISHIRTCQAVIEQRITAVRASLIAQQKAELTKPTASFQRRRRKQELELQPQYPQQEPTSTANDGRNRQSVIEDSRGETETVSQPPSNESDLSSPTSDASSSDTNGPQALCSHRYIFNQVTARISCQCSGYVYSGGQCVHGSSARQGRTRPSNTSGNTAGHPSTRGTVDTEG